MQLFTGWQYMLIDLANAFGLDKKLFEERIQWAEANMDSLESLADQADSKPLYMKAVLAIRKALAGKPTGHTVALDACCSGIQVMSALTGCIAGATNTGLVNPNVRADAYSILTVIMNEDLAANYPIHLSGGVTVIRQDAKDALMTSFYGSKAKPREIFGTDTPQLQAFYTAAEIIAPGASQLLRELLNSWRPYALVHEWKLPDGYDARVKVIQKKEARITVDELDRASFTYEFYVNEGSKTGLSNVANVVHSVDAYVLRCIQRRCDYDVGAVTVTKVLIEEHIKEREDGTRLFEEATADDKQLMYYVDQYERSTMADVVIVPHITRSNVNKLKLTHLKKLNAILDSMLMHKPFHVITVHDEFRCSPNYMNYLRQHYINIFAEIAESELLSDLLSQLYGTKGKAEKLSNNLGSLIRGSNYALS
jgi:hypothetical protein